MKTAKILKMDANKGGLNASLTGNKAQAADPAPMMTRATPAPEGMNEVAAEFWRKKSIHLKQIGRLHAIDLDALELLANLYSDMKRTRKDMDNALTFDLFSRHQKAHNEALKLFKDLARDFGLTPSSRAKIKGGTAGEQADDEWEKI